MLSLQFIAISFAQVESGDTADSGSRSSDIVITVPGKRPLLNLTNQEKAWLQEHQKISVAFDGYFPPYSFLDDNGQFKGLAVDVMQLLADRIGVTFEPFPLSVWKDLYRAAQQHKVDLVATMGDRSERKEWFVFTRPYIFKSLAIMTQQQTRNINSPADLSGKRVALVQSYQYVQSLLEKYPSIKPYYVDTMLDGLNAVSVGKADAVITFAGAGYYLKTKYQIGNLKFVAVLEKDRFTESIGIRKDWPELAPILDKALHSISDDEMLLLRQRWVGLDIVTGISQRRIFTYLAIIGGVALLVFSVFTLWNRSLKRQVLRKTTELQRELIERTKVQELLKKSEERFRAIFNAANDAFFIHDLDTGEILDVNQKMLEMFGLSRQEALSTDIGSLSSGISPYAQEDAVKWVQKAAAGKPQLFTWQSKDKTGRLFWTEVNMRRATIGTVDRIIVTVRDVTERKNAERELGEHRDHLEELIVARTQELTEKTEQLQKSEKSLMYLLEDVNESREQLQKINSEYAVINNELKEFSYVVSHDLKAPLRAIGQLTHWISTDYSTAFDDDGKMQMDLILQRVKRMDGLIDGILRYSRVGRTREKSEPLDLDRLVREVVENIVSLETVQIVIENKLPVVLRDSIRMEQVFQNLIGNAIKFMDKDEGLIKVGCVDGGASWQFSVSDNGPGIDKKYHDRIFQIFQTLAPRDERENTGIGLTLVKKIIGIYGGSIWVESELGRGTTFYFTVPKKEEMDEKL